MASTTMTIPLILERPWPNFSVNAGPFMLTCLRVRYGLAGDFRWGPRRYLFLAIRVGRRLWYYHSDADTRLEISDDHKGKPVSLRRIGIRFTCIG